jgi:hypothetical protein
MDEEIYLDFDMHKKYILNKNMNIKLGINAGKYLLDHFNDKQRGGGDMQQHMT